MPQGLPVVIEGLRLSRLRASAGWAFAVVAVIAVVSLGACIGGPHPLPPGDDSASGPRQMQTPTTASGAAGTSATSSPGPAPNPLAPATPAAMPMADPNSSGAAGAAAVAPRPAAAAGTGAAPATGTGTPATPAPAGGSPGAAGAGGSSGEVVCDGPTGALSSASEAPRNLLFVMDRSVEMATDFDGSPRWQMVAQALSDALGSHATQLTMGAVLYPSARVCDAPSWICSLQQQAMCDVSAMSAADQVAFRPASEALVALKGDAGLYAPVMAAAGVPLSESLARADAALTEPALARGTAVVILASGTPSCAWNAESASATVAKWRESGVRTHVVALPGSPATTRTELAGLAEAGGTGRVHSPAAAGALEATLQSIVFESLSSCTIKLDTPAPDPGAVQVLVTENGVERVLPRTSASGETLWTISADGKTITLAGSACDAARNGGYEAVRIVLGCAR